MPYTTALFIFCCIHFSRSELEDIEYIQKQPGRESKEKIRTNRSVWMKGIVADAGYAL